MRPVRLDPIRPGHESVDYPRPAIAEATFAHIVVRLGGLIIADTLRAVRMLETSHPPSFYLPPDNIAPEGLVQVDGSSFCEWKGHARYFDVSGGGERREKAAWSYPDPKVPFEILRPRRFLCWRDGRLFRRREQVLPQPGGFYGGWITSAIVGPFKGVPGSRFW